MDNIIQQVSSVSGIKYSEEQMKILRHMGGMCIVACAGSGKTSVLVSLLAKRIASGEIANTSKLLVTTYNVAGREELQVRINRLLEKMGIYSKVEIRTLHSAYYKLLKSLNMLGTIGTNGQRLLAIQKALKECEIRLEEEDIQTLDCLLSYQINNMLSDNMLYNDVNFTLDISLDDYTKVRKTFAAKKAGLGFIDFDDLQLQLYVAMKNNESIRDYVRSVWDYFYIDEFQDVSKLQYEILKMMLKDPDKLVVIGDDDQCIYEWRGADPNIILNICGTYDIERFVLSTNYRCGSEIVKKANVGIQNNSNRYVKQMEPFHEGGKINAVYSAGESHYDVSKKAFEKIRHLLLDGVSEEDISVLCRNNVHAVILNNMLLSEGIIHRASAEVKFHDNPMVKDLKACVEIGMNTHNFNIVSSHLWKLVQFFGAKNSSIIANIMRDCSCNLLQAIKCFLIQFCGCFDYEFNDDVRLIQFNASRIYNVRPTHESIQSLKSLYNIIINSENDDATIKVIRVYLGNTIGFLYKSPDRERMIIGIADYFQDILQYGYEHYSKVMSKTSNLSEFEVEQHRKCINLSTMHGAKGKEWKHVILLGIDGNSCPAVHRMNELHGKGISDEDISTYVEQERRLHYVAMTRAKEELTLITDMNDVSPFFLEAMGLLSKEDSLNSHIIRWASNGGYRIGEIADYMEKLSDLMSIYGFDKELGNAHISGCENQDTTDFDEALDMMYDNDENGMDDALKAVNQFVKNCGEYAGIDINDMQE